MGKAIRKCDPQKILVVDDDKDVREMIEEFLKGSLKEHIVVTASDGITACEVWEEHRCSIVILDMMLPGQSGFLVLEKLKRAGNKTIGAREAPLVIMITGNKANRHKMFAEKLGVFNFMTKPFELSELLVVVNQAQALC